MHFLQGLQVLCNVATKILEHHHKLEDNAAEICKSLLCNKQLDKRTPQHVFVKGGMARSKPMTGLGLKSMSSMHLTIAVSKYQGKLFWWSMSKLK